jgi:hypothetical protein
MTYDPDLVNSLSVQGQLTPASGTIKMSIPKSLIGSPGNGTKFTSVTGYAFSQRGALLPMAAGQPNPTSLPTQIDASGASTFVVGQAGPQFDGVVEVSIDDPNFNAPRQATIAADINQSSWQLQLSGSDLVPGPHTVYVRQRINGRDPSSVVSLPFNVADTIEQSVSSLVSFSTANPRSNLGVSSYDLSMRNTSTLTIFPPLRLELASITSTSGVVTVANADNGLPGAGAVWDYSTKLGSDGVLTSNELSGSRNIRFNNPNNEAFTVTFNVFGNLPRGASSATATSTSESSGDNTQSGSDGSASGTVTGVVLKLTYNPLLNNITIQILKP